MHTMKLLLGVMGGGSAAFVGLSAYAVAEAHREARMPKKHLDLPKIDASLPVAPVEVVPVEVIPQEEVGISLPVVEEIVPETSVPSPVAAVLEMGYWPIRGLAAPMRMILEYTGVPYQDNQVDAEAWFGKLKPEMLKFNALMNLPYVKDGDTYVAQSNACLQYLGAKLGIDPVDVLDPAAISNVQVLNEIFDLRNSLVDLSYPSRKVSRSQEEFEMNRVSQLGERVPQSYAKLEAHLEQKGTAFFSAQTPLSGDFHVWEMIDQHEALAQAAGTGSPLVHFPKLHSFYTTFRQLPQLEKYFASDAYRLPINAKMAWFA